MKAFPPLAWPRPSPAFLALACLAALGGGCAGSAPPFDDASAVWRDYDADKAFDHVREIVEMGPRPPGSEGIELSRVYLEEQLASWGWQTRRQTFTQKTPEGQVEFVNLRARWAPRDTEELWQDRVHVLLCSHYDTKLYRDLVFVGANDPASSMGAVLEAARVFGARPGLARRMELVFFDGEEAFGPNITPTDGLYGSREYGRRILRPLRPRDKPRWGVLLDMVGDRDLIVTLPADTPPDLMRLTLQAAEDLGYRSYFSVSRFSIIDDHIPLNAEGVPTVDIIDFDYKYWHTPADTLDKLSPESLGITGRVALLLIEKYLMAE